MKTEMSPVEWIRLFREQPFPNLPNVFYCPGCERLECIAFAKRKKWERCLSTGAMLYRLDDTFWRKISRSIKRAYRKDRWLLARIKAEFPDWSLPKLEGSFAWLNDAWKKAPRPKGRPQNIAMRFFLADWINTLSAHRYVFKATPDGTPYFEVQRPLMSRNMAVQELGDFMRIDGVGVQKQYGGLQLNELENLAQAFQREANERFGSVPTMEQRDVQRAIGWVKRVQQDPGARISGEKMR
jgi:hypothetical protein